MQRERPLGPSGLRLLSGLLVAFTLVAAATAPPAISTWLGWAIGGIPLYGLLVFLLSQ